MFSVPCDVDITGFYCTSIVFHSCSILPFFSLHLRLSIVLLCSQCNPTPEFQVPNRKGRRSRIHFLVICDSEKEYSERLRFKSVLGCQDEAARLVENLSKVK